MTEQAYWSLQESSLAPQCVVTPHDSDEAAEAITVLVSSVCQSEKFAIKGNGHAPAAGFANVDGGVTIDTTSLTTITLSHDRSVVTVGTGNNWLDVYAYLDPHNLTVAGGRNGRVGVGGLTLGGGISYFSPQVGFTCDTVVNFELVQASGKLINANATSYPDIYKALKGGTNNFGLVTAFTFATIPYTKILGGSLVNTITHRDAVFKAFANIASAPNYDVHASIVTSVVFNSTSKAWVLSSTPAYTLPEEHPRVYNELFSVPNISDTLHLTNLSTFSNESATPPLNWLFYTGTYGVSSDLLNRFFDIANNTLYSAPAGELWVFAFEPLPTAFVAAGAGNNSLGTSPKSGNSMILLISAAWPDPASDKQVQAKAVGLMSKLNGAAASMGLRKGFVYANYANQLQKPLDSYGAANLAALKGVAKKYDPAGVFQKQAPGGFKLFVW